MANVIAAGNPSFVTPSRLGLSNAIFAGRGYPPQRVDGDGAPIERACSRRGWSSGQTGMKQAENDPSMGRAVAPEDG
jgi:hypothetical protein